MEYINSRMLLETMQHINKHISTSNGTAQRWFIRNTVLHACVYMLSRPSTDASHGLGSWAGGAVVFHRQHEPGLFQELLGPQGQVRSARSGVLELEGDKGVYSFRISEQTSDFRAIQFKHDAEKTEWATTNIINHNQRFISCCIELFCSSGKHFCL